MRLRPTCRGPGESASRRAGCDAETVTQRREVVRVVPRLRLSQPHPSLVHTRTRQRDAALVDERLRARIAGLLGLPSAHALTVQEFEPLAVVEDLGQLIPRADAEPPLQPAQA